MTAVVIRAMTEAIKGEGEEKGKGSKEKEGIGYIVSVWIHISVSRLRVYAFYSFFFLACISRTNNTVTATVHTLFMNSSCNI